MKMFMIFKEYLTLVLGTAISGASILWMRWHCTAANLQLKRTKIQGTK
jgi:hypothetical protein